MFSIPIRTNRQSSNNVFYFLHTLFLLHICTAFFTVINATHHNDNEAIIQLSIDSIHIVKSSDSRFANIEENVNDDEEKELLMALLTSFDDDYKNTKQIDLEETEHNNEVSLTNNCTSSSSSSSSVPTTTTTIPLTIHFIPSSLDFGDQSIAMPRMQTVMIINDDQEPLELHSLSGTTVQFYSSFFTQKILPPNGGNTSINVYYLPRTVGIARSTFTIKTNRGVFHYHVNGIGTLNPFRIRPLITATIPLNSTYESTIHFYNPYNYSIDITEIYTSDENLIIELLSYKNLKTQILKTFEHNEEWHLKPYEVKAIIKINYLASKLDRLHGFYCIKTTSNDTIIVPVEINVSNRLSLYSNVDLLEFTTSGLVRSTSISATIPVYVINNGINPVNITDVRVTTANTNYITVHHEKVQVPPGIHHLSKIADLTIHPSLIPIDIKRIRGSVQIHTLQSSSSSPDDEQPILQIPFRATILHGALEFEKASTYFYYPSPSIELSDEKTEKCQSVAITNRFNVSIVMYNITADRMDLLSQYIKINMLSPYTYASVGQSIVPFCVEILKQPLSSAGLTHLEAALTLHTNLSFFYLPIQLYNGLLSLNLITDMTNVGIQRNDANPMEFFIASIPVNTSRTVKFILINKNPIDISIETISLTLSHTNIQLTQMQLLNGSETKQTFKSSYKNDAIIELVIPTRHQAIFSLTINGTSEPLFYDEIITFKTRYENLNVNFKYRIISGSIELENKLPLHIDAFPNRLGTVDVFLRNGLGETIDVVRMIFPSYGKSFSFIWNETSPGKLTIESNETHRIGKLNFDMIPLCNSIQVPSESTCYCGLNNHPEFKQRWEQHVSALNTYELDHTLVSKFRNLWKEWTSLVRKERIQTNIWLVTSEANTSWPVTIGFVWPSVLEHMSSSLSRTPVILDFHLTLINTTKTQNVIITNPSSNILICLVELISSYENKKTRNKKISINNDQVFTIATAFKRIESIDGIYKFSLLPSEHIIFTTSYRPKLSTKTEIYLVVRNNLTIIESIILRGEGGSGSLTVGNRRAGSSDIPLVLEMNEKEYKLCSNYLSTDGTNENPVLQKVITLRNTGNMKAIINDISFGHSKCSGQGFTVRECSNIEIEPNERYDLHIRFQPDYTLAEIGETLTLNTNIGLMTFPIIVRIPQRVLAACYQTIPRPVWELRIHWLCLFSVSIILLLILSAAVYDARRLCDDYLARVELRNRISASSQNTLDLTDLTAAVQDEQKIRERIESRSSINAKKDTSNNENKNKSKRPITSMNGNKDNGETSSKAIRTSDGSNTSVRSVATSPKAVSSKQRRSTTDNGPPKLPKHQHETPAKPQQLRAQKSVTTEQHPVVTPRPPTPPPPVPSSAVSDEEKEPFVVARPKRAPTKTKESIISITPVKSTTATDGVVPLQSTSPPPPPPPLVPSIVISKPSTRSNLSEQRHHQQDLSRSSDSINEQQWHMVSSNRGPRKGATTTSTRRETTDDCHITNKTNKSASTNPENPMVPSSSLTHASASHQTTQSRRRNRGRRPARTISPTPVPILTKIKSLQTNTPLSVNNLELAFRQLTEQLWAAGLPSSATACSMSIRSRCSSAPPSERDGGGDEMTKIDWTNYYDNEEEKIIDWDEPDKPDEDFGRYVSQTEQSMDEPIDINEWTQPSSTIDDIPSLMSLSTAPSAIITTNIPQKTTMPSAIITEDVELLPFPQHGPGPIQRPNKLACPHTQQAPSYLTTSIQSPGTPDVLDQINRLLDHQNSTTTAVSSPPIVNNSSVSSPIMNDLTTPNNPWTTFSPAEWPSKYDSSWPSTSIQSPTVSLTTQVQNPFAVMSTISEQQRQPTRDKSSVWPSVLGTATPRLISSSTRTLRASTWNELFSSTVPSSTESTKPTNNSWLKFWSAPDPSSADGTSPNGHETEPNNPFWNLNTLSDESVVPSSTPNQQQTSSSAWWAHSSSDENNNKNQTNRLNDDTKNNRDQSRWDFAR